MFWETCEISFFESHGSKYVKISGSDIVAHNPYWVYISEDCFNELLMGTPINKCVSDSVVKHFLSAGIAPSASSIFPFQRIVKHQVYVTNAVANSIAFLAMSYINNCGYTPSQLNTLRAKCKIKESRTGKFRIYELKMQFIQQSITFLEMYIEAHKNLKTFLASLNISELERIYHCCDIIKIRNWYKRFVFHNKLECDFMRSDYQENGDFYRNTGVFSEHQILGNSNVYLMDKSYLEKLGMRLCKICDL